MQCFIRQHSKCHRFFRVGGHSELIGEIANAIPSGAISFRSKAIRVGFNAPPAGDNHFLISSPLSKHQAPHRIGDGSSR